MYWSSKLQNSHVLFFSIVLWFKIHKLNNNKNAPAFPMLNWCSFVSNIFSSGFIKEKKNQVRKTWIAETLQI